jgi:tetratricopeptide (TPR) repeat protein
MTSQRNALLAFIILSFSVHLTIAVHTAEALTSGQSAPAFALQDAGGHTHKLVETKGRQMTVLYFFDVASPSSQEGLLMLDKLLKQYADKQLTVWGIARTTREAAQKFSQKARLRFPILLDTADVSRRYNAQIILPVICSLGPDLKVLDFIQGGGKAAEVMLVRLAERQLHRNQPELAEAMAAEAAKKNPHDPEARAMQGYAALQQGHTAEAGKVFKRLSKLPGKGGIVGKEGQAAVLAREGKTEKALALADEVVRAAPHRSAAYKIRGDLLAGKGDTHAAQAAYEKAVKQPHAVPFLKAEAYNQLGRIYAQKGQYAKARSLFDNAVNLDPYYLEPTSNKGVTYEKEGMWTKALSEYRKAIALDKSDTIATVLARKAEQMLALQADTAARARMDRLVADLVKRYKSGKSASARQAADEWTSRPMVLTFVDVQEKGGLASRDGLAIVLTTRLGELLDKSGRVHVVERAVEERLLSELNLGSSELADPDTALRLGRLLAAKLIGTGSLLYLPNSTLLNLRLIDTETSAIAKTITMRIGTGANLERELNRLNRDILKTVMEKYPLQGYVVQASSKEVMLNLGRKQGVSTGSAFAVIEPGQSITYRGKVLRGAARTVARLEVVRVEPDLCYARVAEEKRPLKRDDQVKEVLPEVVLHGGPNS